MDVSRHRESADPARDTSAPCFVHILPPELLCEIFTYLDKYRDQLSSTMVCRTWRTASLASPAQLWSYVVSKGRKPEALGHALARTANVPVSVTVTVLDANASHVASAFQLHMHHIRNLAIDVGAELGPSAARSLAIALSVPAPILETLIIIDVTGSIPRAVAGAPSGSPLNCAPKLSALKLNGQAGDYALHAFCPFVARFLYAPSDELLSTAVIEDHIALMDSLEVLAIEFDAWLDITQRTTRIRLPAFLKTLHLFSQTESVDIRGPLGLLFPCSVQLLTVEYTNGCDVQVATELVTFMCGRFPPRKMSIFSSYQSNNVVLEADSCEGLVWEVLEVSPDFTHGIFQNLRTLCISDPEWTRLSGRIPTPLLASLSVRLITPYFIKEDGHKSLFLDMTASGLLVAPKLHTLAFTTVPRESEYCLGYTPALAPDMLCDFIRCKIEGYGERLALLRLNGVDILQNVVEPVIALLDLVDDIQFGAGSDLDERDDVQRMSPDWWL